MITARLEKRHNPLDPYNTCYELEIHCGKFSTKRIVPIEFIEKQGGLPILLEEFKRAFDKQIMGHYEPLIDYDEADLRAEIEDRDDTISELEGQLEESTEIIKSLNERLSQVNKELRENL